MIIFCLKHCLIFHGLKIHLLSKEIDTNLIFYHFVSYIPNYILKYLTMSSNPSALKDLIYERFKPIFFAYDKDNNSSLDPQELRFLLAENLGVNQKDITQDQLDWHFHRIDKNKDGKITFEQYFSHFFEGRAENAQPNIQNKEDDLIDINEFTKLMEDTFKPLKIPITEEMVRWNFDKIDVDHSGRISFNEYLEFIKKYNQ